MAHYDYSDPYGYATPTAPAGTQLFSQAEANDLNEEYDATRSQRIRAAMFADSLPDTQPPVQDLGRSANVNKLAQPSQVLKGAVVDLINFQDDFVLTDESIPILIDLLNDKDPMVVRNAARVVHELCKKDASLAAVRTHPQLLTAIAGAMQRPDALDETIQHCAGTLNQLARTPDGMLAIFRSGGIAALVRMLESRNDRVVYYAISTLHGLLQHQDGAKAAVRSAGGVPRMVRLLQRQNQPRMIAFSADCLHILSFQHPETRLAILHENAQHDLVRILCNQQHEKLLWTTSRLVKVLTVCPKNKAAFVQAGGTQALALHLRGSSPRVRLQSLYALRNISDAATREENVEKLIEALVQLLRENDLQCAMCAAGILSNLTCNNQRNKASVCRAGGVESLLQAIAIFPDRDEVTEPAICALRHSTSRQPDADIAQNAVRVHGGLPVVLGLLNPQSQWPLVKAVVGLVRNLATCPANQAPLRELNTIPAIGQILRESFNDAQRAGEAGTYEGGVGMLEVVEVSTNALQCLAKDPANRSIIIQLNMYEIFVQLLMSRSDGLQRVGAGVLAELAQDPTAAGIIERQGATAPLTEALHSKNESIATYAAAVLYRMAHDKPDEYRKRLGMELTSALHRSEDSAPWAQEGLADLRAMPNDEPWHDNNMFQNGTYEPGTWNTNTGGDQSMSYGTIGSGSVAPPRQGGAAPPHGTMSWYDTDL